MPHIALFTTAIDIILFSVVFYVIVYAMYGFFLGRNIKEIVRIDLRYSVVAILLIVANYYGSGAMATVAGYDIHWFFYYLIVSFFVEFVVLIIYKKLMGISWSDLAK